MLLGHPQQICGHGRRSQKLILEELTLVPTRRAREECYDGSRAKPTHGCTSSFTKDKCYTFQSRPSSYMYLATKKNVSNKSTNLEKKYHQARERIRRESGEFEQSTWQSDESERKMRQFNTYRLTVPTVLATSRVKSKIGPTHIAHPGREQGLYGHCDDSSGVKIYLGENQST